MGLFKSKEEKKAIADERDAKYIANHPELYKDKALVDKIFKDGISSVAKPEDYSKIIIEQNETIIKMLGILAAAQGLAPAGFAGEEAKKHKKIIKKVVLGL